MQVHDPSQHSGADARIFDASGPNGNLCPILKIKEL